ncbi:MAG: transposase [Gemmatimonadaceae bacterium]
MLPGLPRLRAHRYYRAMHRVLNHYLGDRSFRVVHISIQSNHLHLVVEASDRRALTRCMQSLAIRAAREINRAYRNRVGKVFAHRYHATQITTPRQARNTLAYVLNNWRKHREDRRTHDAQQLDPYASGLTFRGWSGTPRFRVPDNPLPVSAARTQLLRFDWELFGLIGCFEVPGAPW